MSKVITIAQQKGGAGKTTLAAHLAVALRQQGKKVAVLDIDPQGSLTRWHQEREARFGEEFTGLLFSQLTGWRVGSEIHRLRDEVDVIIVDSPPHTQTEARTAIREANLVLIPMQPSPMDQWATDATVHIAARENVPAYLVMNRVTSNSKLAEFFAQDVQNLLSIKLGNRVSFAQAMLDGRTVTEMFPKSPGAEEIKALSKEVWKLVTTAPATATAATEEKAEIQSPVKRRKVHFVPV